MLRAFPRHFDAADNGQDQRDLNDFAWYERKRTGVDCAGPTQSHPEREPSATTGKNDRFARNQSAGEADGRKTRKAIGGHTFNDQARDKGSRWICEQIACSGSGEPERAWRAKRLK